MTTDPAAVLSTALVATDRPGRYAKQLVSHLSRRVAGTWSDETGRGELDFGTGRGELVALDTGLSLTVEGPAEDIARLEDVVGRHLVRFGTRDELVVTWRRADGTTGSEQRNPGETD